VILSTMFENKLFGILLIFAFPFTFGLISVISINKNIKNSLLVPILSGLTYSSWVLL